MVPTLYPTTSHIALHLIVIVIIKTHQAICGQLLPWLMAIKCYSSTFVTSFTGYSRNKQLLNGGVAVSREAPNLANPDKKKK